MTEIKTYHILPTSQIPNSPRPLLHYKNVLAKIPNSLKRDPLEAYNLFNRNGWKVSWIFRYGPTQLSHYHSQAHEVMAVLSGTATIRFGTHDISEDLDENTHDRNGGLELDAEPGDVFVIPAGVAHKTYNAKPEAELKLLTPGRARGIEIETGDIQDTLSNIELSGFTMMGAYSGGDWDFVKSGGDYENIWSVPKPGLDPVFGRGEQGLLKTWPGSDAPPSSNRMFETTPRTNKL